MFHRQSSAQEKVESSDKKLEHIPSAQHTDKKDSKDMNAEAARDENKNEAPKGDQNRVDIPGGNYQRPGANQPGIPGAMGQQQRPGAYPGSFAGNYAGSSPAGAAATSSERKLVIGPGITLSGEIEACDHLIVEGTVEAALKGASRMDIAEAGAFYGTVEIDEAVIAGRFEGDLTVKGRLTIRATGSITGAIAYKELAVEAGATLDGKVNPLEGSKANTSGGKKFSDASSKKKAASDNGAELPFGNKTAAE